MMEAGTILLILGEVVGEGCSLVDGCDVDGWPRLHRVSPKTIPALPAPERFSGSEMAPNTPENPCFQPDLSCLSRCVPGREPCRVWDC